MLRWSTAKAQSEGTARTVPWQEVLGTFRSREKTSGSSEREVGVGDAEAEAGETNMGHIRRIMSQNFIPQGMDEFIIHFIHPASQLSSHSSSQPAIQVTNTYRSLLCSQVLSKGS